VYRLFDHSVFTCGTGSAFHIHEGLVSSCSLQGTTTGEDFNVASKRRASSELAWEWAKIEVICTCSDNTMAFHSIIQEALCSKILFFPLEFKEVGSTAGF
jgi:hypothetical protein